MPVHDWTRVDAGIFHAFHHGWIEELARALNRGRLPPDYYALPEQFAAGFGPDVLTLQGLGDADEPEGAPTSGPASTGVALAPPRLKPTPEPEMGFYRRKQKISSVRHVSGHRILPMV